VSAADPVQEFFSIGEVCELTDLKPHVLRYWESQFRFLNPAKNRSGNRVYQRREVELILLVKHLLYTEKYTIEGARQKVDEHRKGGELRAAARAALTLQTLDALESELTGLIESLAPSSTKTAAVKRPKQAKAAGRGAR
jgi:DNA-binding transcriptional MerR regulator